MWPSGVSKDSVRFVKGRAGMTKALIHTVLRISS